ncbi:MAG: gamma-glutamyltransferase, partial [Terracidiphilus sp.]
MHLRLMISALAALGGVAFAISVYAGAQEDAKNVIPYLDEQPVRARHGMVVSVHHRASDAGVAVLREGGNAIDAAVATGFALAVVHPVAGNLGGGGFLLLRTRDGRSTFIDFREKAPLAASETMYQDAQGNVIPDSSVIGYRSIATPGSVAGLVYAERKYGRLGLKRVMAPAIELAGHGFELTEEEARELTDPDLAAFPESKRIFQRGGQFYTAGEIFKQPELARTLERIAANPDDFYHGKMAEELIEELARGGSLLTLDDLAQYTVVERTPIVGNFHNYTIVGAPPPSSGGIVLLSALNILEGYDLARLGDRSPESMHLIAEAFRRAYLDRAEYLGDPDYNRIPVAELTSKSYAAAWRAGIAAGAATPSAALVRP